MGIDTKRLDFPKDAFVNKETGMYQSPDPLQNDAEFAEAQIGSTAEGKPVSIFLPISKKKPCRYLRFENATQLEVDESVEECKANVDKAKANMQPGAWFSFTDPTYGTELAVPASALATCMAVVVGFVDLELVQLQQAENERQKQFARMAALKRK